jgi:hypothetical protein
MVLRPVNDGDIMNSQAVRPSPRNDGSEGNIGQMASMSDSRSKLSTRWRKKKFGINGVCHKLKDTNKNDNFMASGTQNIQHCSLNGVCFHIIFRQNQLIPSEWALKFTVAVVTTWVAGSTDISYTQTL